MRTTCDEDYKAELTVALTLMKTRNRQDRWYNTGVLQKLLPHTSKRLHQNDTRSTQKKKTNKNTETSTAHKFIQKGRPDRPIKLKTHFATKLRLQNNYKSNDKQNLSDPKPHNKHIPNSLRTKQKHAHEPLLHERHNKNWQNRKPYRNMHHIHRSNQSV